MMKKTLLMLFVLAALSTSAYAAVDFDHQNWELDMASTSDTDC